VYGTGGSSAEAQPYYARAEAFRQAAKNAQSSGVPLSGVLVTQGSVLTAQTLARQLDFLFIDGQHGYLDETLIGPLLTAIAPCPSLPIVRVPWNDPGTVMKALDMGALGIIAPMISTRQQCEDFVGACRYAPRGYRSWGPTRLTAFDPSAGNPERAQRILTLAMIETAEAVDNLDDILSVSELDGIFVGPADLALTYGHPPQQQTNEAMLPVLAGVARAAADHDLISGIAPLSLADAHAVKGMGYGFMTLTSDLGLLSAGVAAVTGELGL